MAQLRMEGVTKRATTQRSVNATVGAACDILRRSNCASALQCVPELTWLLFLRILDECEAQEADAAEAVGAAFTPSIDSPYRWRDWAAPGSPKRSALQSGAVPLPSSMASSCPTCGTGGGCARPEWRRPGVRGVLRRGPAGRGGSPSRGTRIRRRLRPVVPWRVHPAFPARP